MGRSVRRGLLGALLVFIGGPAVFAASVLQRPAVGAQAQGERLKRIEASPHWRDGKFRDVLPRVEPDIWEASKRWFSASGEHRQPDAPVRVMHRKQADFAAQPASGLRITWLGHSTLLVEIDGSTLLFDPVWGQYAAPIAYEGTRRFFPPPLPFEELPKLDAVVISHDHYDHLDYPTMVDLARSQVPFFVPLGVGAHLEHWGVSPDRITELDWWEQREIGGLTLVETPARHFSGRALSDRDQTLWAGWAVLGPAHRVFYSGDTAMFPGFTEIGQRLGPFDATMIESGAYNQLWADVHLGPEQAVEAHRMVRGRVMLPVHWGLFDLAMHSWTEPVERVLVAARSYGIPVATPRPGESIEPDSLTPSAQWWPKLPWESAEQAPIVSSSR